MNSVLVTARQGALSGRSRSSYIPAAADQRLDVPATPIAMRVTSAPKAPFQLDLKHALESPDPLFSYT